ncbi:hypothetical protein NM208_g3129 [Fusarium decemcellulare]|uniref:Uncharacterized protein n=1 Tax=Fusarium decemcellulare TaxID=57161 RepID=A0ACC1SQ37_9HYPO|nr:hypothetical protein NM208_g3129 [Fusarium decemcellulare]
MTRLSKDVRNSETLAALQDMQGLRISDGAKLPCFMITYGLNLRFFGRDAELKALREILDPTPERKTLRAAGIYGLGGVGKSQLALHYANTSMDKYGVIAWIPSETQIKLVQALSSLAGKLGLVEDGSEDDHRDIQRVRDWLNTSKKPFLLIFDNAENIDILDQIWPASDKGSIIVTTRSPTQASKRASDTLALQSFSTETGKQVLEFLTSLKPVDKEDEAAAQEICQLLGGLPLALVQISGFIQDRGYSYTEFLRIYKKSEEKIFAKSEKPVEYNDTVFTTWNISLQKLSEEATRLQNLLVFFDPDLIPERLITNIKAEIDDPDLEFLFDDFDFGDAVMELTRTSMISRLSSSKALSMHRLVQLAVFARLSKAERVKFFDLTIHILYHDFPNTWQKRGAHQGHGWQSWEICNAILSHVNWLMKLSDKHKIKSSNPERWAELVFRAGTYLWEKEQPTLAKSFFEFGLSIDEDISGPIAAQAHRLLGNVFLDLAQPRAALSTYKKTLELREKVDGYDSPPVADVCNSIACAYTEAGEVEHAFEYLEKATTIHNSHDPGKMMRTLAIRSMTCLRAGQPENALTAIRECWRLQGMTQDEIEASPYPKHSGDIMLLARIYWLQENKREAQKLVSRTVAMRRGTFGENGGPRVADSLFTLAQMLQDGGELVLAAKLLRQIVEMSGDAPGMKPHKARALWFSADVEAKIGAEKDRVAELRENARAVRQTVGGREWPDEDTDEAFMNLVSWMLW